MMLNVLSQQTPKSSRKLEFREQFSPRLISALYKNFKDANSAILELIDNAIDDRIPGKLFVVTVEVHGNKITIINKGGKGMGPRELEDRKSTRLNSSHSQISYAVFCLKKKY